MNHTIPDNATESCATVSENEKTRCDIEEIIVVDDMLKT